MRKLASLDLSATLSRRLTIRDVTIALPEQYWDWTEQHDAQGFFWQPGLVEFNLLGDFGAVKLEIWQAEETFLDPEIILDPETVRAILVPFSQKSATIQVTGDDLEPPISLPPEYYALIFEVRFLNEEELQNDLDYQAGDEELGLIPEWCRLTFVPQLEPIEPKILRWEGEKAPPKPLLIEPGEVNQN